MRTETIVITDDIDGTEDAQTVSFGLDGVSYTIDLSVANHARLTAALAPFIANATRVRNSTTHHKYTGPRGTGSSGGTFPDLSRVRIWAAKNDMHVGVRGRIPKTVLDAYAAAGGK